MTTTLDIPSSNVRSPLGNGSKYRIENVSVSGAAMENNYVNEVKNKARERYPELFSEDTSAVPLDVNCDLKDNNGFGRVAGFIGYSLLLGIIPVPIPNSNIVEVKVKSEYSNINEIEYELESTFFLTVLTPLGLMGIPGRSDYKTKQGIIGLMQNMPTYMAEYIAVNLPTNIADAVARSIIDADKKTLADVRDKYKNRFGEFHGFKEQLGKSKANNSDHCPSPGKLVATSNFAIKSFALVAGLGEYKNKELSSLPYAENDAYDFVDELKKVKFNKDNIKILNNKNAAGADIKSCLKQAEGNDLIIFWSGRAYKSGDIYLLCYDSKPQDSGSALSLRSMMKTVKNKNPRHVIFILDLCSADGKTLDIQEYFNELRMKKQVPKGWVFIVSASPDREAEKKSDWKNGALTYCLLQGLRGKADGAQDLTPKDGKITLREIYNYLSYVMPVETGEKIKQTKYASITVNPDNQAIWEMEFCAK
ncbi:MAG: caspase family protein [Victivallaceae bacterium]